MYHVSAQGVDERMINVHYYYYYIRPSCPKESSHRVSSRVSSAGQRVERQIIHGVDAARQMESLLYL